MPFEQDTWEKRQRDYRAQEDRDDAEFFARYPEKIDRPEPTEREASTGRTFDRKRGRK